MYKTVGIPNLRGNDNCKEHLQMKIKQKKHAVNKKTELRRYQDRLGGSPQETQGDRKERWAFRFIILESYMV